MFTTWQLDGCSVSAERQPARRPWSEDPYMSRCSLRVLSTAGMLLAAACRVAPCCAPPLGGFLQVTTATTGANVDSGGYTLVVKPQVVGRDSLTRAIGVNDAITWELEPVTSAVTLEEVQSNCLVLDENPRLITLVQGDTAATTFRVNCS